MENTLQRQSLYHIEQDHLTILAQIEENEGIITPELDQALQLSNEAIQQKGISYGWAIKKFLNESKIIKNEIDRLQSLKERADNIAEILKQKLSDGMQIYGIEKIETPTLKLSFRKSESVNVFNESLVPNHYKEDIVKVYVSKPMIKEAFKSGIDVPGAELVEHKNLQIR